MQLRGMFMEFRVHSAGARSLHYREVGSYQTGCFYSEAMFGVPHETDVLRGGIGRGDEPAIGGSGGPLSTMRGVILLHETAHFVQDLSLGAAVESDYLRDQSLGVLMGVLQRLIGQRGIRLPLISLQPDLARKDAEELAFILEREKLAELLMSEAVVVQFTSGNGQPAGRPLELSGAVLMEGLAAAHTARSLRSRARGEADLTYLEEVAEDIQILPEQLGPPYSTPLQVFTGALGQMSGREDRPWPRDAESPSGYADIGCTFLADIACHVPPLEIMQDRLESGRNELQDFMPGHRFVRAVMAVRESGGFPDAPPAGSTEDFYQVLFNMVARRWGWPSWRETSDAWLEKLHMLKVQRRSAGDAYRFRLLVERAIKPTGEFILDDPLTQCWQQGVPVLHNTPAGFKLLQAYIGPDSMTLTPLEGPLTPLEWLSLNPKPWEDMPPGPVDELTAMRAHAEMALPLFLQEIVSRTIGRAFQHSVIFGSSFHCPYAQAGCAAARPACDSMTSLGDLPASGCAVRTWLARWTQKPERLSWA